MKVSFSRFNPAARSIVALANLISVKRERTRIDDDDLMLAIAAVESPASDALKRLDVNLPSLAKVVDFDPSGITQVALSGELPIPELDIYQDFNPSGAFVVRWAPTLALNTACRNVRENPDCFPLGEPADLIVRPEHILFVALLNKTAAPSKMVEKAYHGSSHDPAGILREDLGFISCDVTGAN